MNFFQKNLCSFLIANFSLFIFSESIKAYGTVTNEKKSLESGTHETQVEKTFKPIKFKTSTGKIVEIRRFDREKDIENGLELYRKLFEPLTHMTTEEKAQKISLIMNFEAESFNNKTLEVDGFSAWIDNKFVGFFIFHPMAEKGHYYLRLTCVDPKLHKQGIFKILLNAFLASNQEAKRLFWLVQSRNKNGREIYAHLGGTEIPYENTSWISYLRPTAIPTDFLGCLLEITDSLKARFYVAPEIDHESTTNIKPLSSSFESMKFKTSSGKVVEVRIFNPETDIDHAIELMSKTNMGKDLDEKKHRAHIWLNKEAEDLKNNTRGFVWLSAWIDNHLAGFITFNSMQEEGSCLCRQVAISPEFQNQNLLKILCSACISLTPNIKKLYWGIRVINTNGLNLCSYLGAQKTTAEESPWLSFFPDEINKADFVGFTLDVTEDLKARFCVSAEQVVSKS